MIYAFYQPLFSAESDRLHDWRDGLYGYGPIILVKYYSLIMTASEPCHRRLGD